MKKNLAVKLIKAAGVCMAAALILSVATNALAGEVVLTGYTNETTVSSGQSSSEMSLEEQMNAGYAAAPTLKKVSRGSGFVTIKWKKIAGAAGYRVFRKTSGGEWKIVAGSTTKKKYTDTSVKDDKTYIYTVRAYFGSYEKAKKKAYKKKYWSAYDASGITAYALGTINTGENTQTEDSGKENVNGTNTGAETENSGETAVEMDEVVNIGSSDLIWFGDSRTVRMGKYVYGYKEGKSEGHSIINKAHVVARSGAAYSWASTAGFEYLCRKLDANPDAKVILNFGINDLTHIPSLTTGNIYAVAEKYVELYSDLKKSYPDATFYVMSVNPINGAKHGHTKDEINNAARIFNSYLRSNFDGEGYLDTFNNVSYSASKMWEDKIHYSKYGTKKIFKYVTGKTKP